MILGLVFTTRMTLSRAVQLAGICGAAPVRVPATAARQHRVAAYVWGLPRPGIPDGAAASHRSPVCPVAGGFHFHSTPARAGGCCARTRQSVFARFQRAAANDSLLWMKKATLALPVLLPCRNGLCCIYGSAVVGKCKLERLWSDLKSDIHDSVTATRSAFIRPARR